MSVRVVSVASRCITLFPTPASTPSRQHQFGADQHGFGSPALARCQHHPHFYCLTCGVPAASVRPLSLDANTTPTSTTSRAACLRLRFPRSRSMPTHPHFYSTSRAVCLRLRFARSRSMPTPPPLLLYFTCGVPAASVRPLSVDANTPVRLCPFF